MVLLHALVQLGAGPLIGAHLDHGWRPESREEALRVVQWAESLGVRCHLGQAERMEGNLEEAGRKARLAFFQRVAQEEGAEAVLLAHHASDQAETVVKRLLEGAPLQKLGGMGSCTAVEGMALWRPLLGTSRKEIEQYAARFGLDPIDDPTNRDPKFLRARLRTRLLPLLTEELGKEVVSNLCLLGERIRSLSEYLDMRVVHVEWKTGWLGDWLEGTTLHPVEWEHLLRIELTNRRLSLSAQQVNLLVERLASGTRNIQITCGETAIAVDRGRLFFLHTAALSRLQSSEWRLGGEGGAASWRGVWSGQLSIAVPSGEYRVGPAAMSTPLAGRRTLGRWLTSSGVPFFLRTAVPVLWSGDRVVADFLSGGNFGGGQTVSIFLQGRV